MDNEKMGQFISELRKSHQMTQKELAEKLDVSDKAVSKWERGLSCPDISLLSPLSDILGITTTELLNGERKGQGTVNTETSVVNALEYVGRTTKSKARMAQDIAAGAFSITLLLGIFVVCIVNAATAGALTWGLIPISACIFTWLVTFPVVKSGGRGVIGSLVAASLLIVPFLYVLDLVINRLMVDIAPIFSMGVRIAPLGVVFCWVAFLLFKKRKTRRLRAAAILVLLASPLTFFINIIIADTLDLPRFDIWTVLNVMTPVVAAAILIIIDLLIQKKDGKA